MASELETRVLRKITYRIVPFIMLLYFIAFIDRVNIGFASLTMNKDLGFSPAVFGFGAGTLPRILPVRGAIEPDIGKGRRPHLDRPGNDHLGHHLRRHGFH